MPVDAATARRRALGGRRRTHRGADRGPWTPRTPLALATRSEPALLLLLEPPLETARLPELTPVAGQACAEAIAHVTGLTPEIKLPNDILVGGRKTAGILAEARDGRVVLGIGVNVNVTLA